MAAPGPATSLLPFVTLPLSILQGSQHTHAGLQMAGEDPGRPGSPIVPHSSVPCGATIRTTHLVHRWTSNIKFGSKVVWKHPARMTRSRKPQHETGGGDSRYDARGAPGTSSVLKWAPCRRDTAEDGAAGDAWQWRVSWGQLCLGKRGSRWKQTPHTAMRPTPEPQACR